MFGIERLCILRLSPGESINRFNIATLIRAGVE